MKLLITISLLLTSLTALSADQANGKKLYKKINCAQCHSKDGMGKAKVKNGKLKLGATKGPRIAGLEEAYAIEQLTAIQGKDKATMRKTKYTMSMKSKIKKLTPAEIADIAAYISKHINTKAGAHKGMLQ